MYSTSGPQVTYDSAKIKIFKGSTPHITKENIFSQQYGAMRLFYPFRYLLSTTLTPHEGGGDLVCLLQNIISVVYPKTISCVIQRSQCQQFSSGLSVVKREKVRISKTLYKQHIVYVFI